MIMDRDFLREVRAIAVPVTAQSVVMSLLLVTDQLMVGQLGTTAVAAVGISSKLTGVLIVALTGLATGVSIFAAQHWGSGDRDRIRHLLGLGLLLGFVFATAITFAVTVFPRAVMSPFTADSRVLAEGAMFVRVIALGYLPTMLTLMYSAVLRSTGAVRLPMWASIAAAVLNLALDWLLIFGHLGLPRLGLEGAAIATTAARFVEIAVILIGAYVTRHVVAVTRLADLRGADARLLRRFAVVALPLAFNELLWVLGETAYVVVYGRMGTDSLAAMAMTFPVQSLAIGLLTGLASTAGVLVGQRLGRSDLADASLRGNQLISGGVVAALGVGVLVAAGSSMYVGLFAVPGEVRHMGQLCLLVFAGFLWVKVANMILAGAVLNAGGDSRFVLIMESLATWVVGVPTAFVAAFVFGFPVWAVYLVLSLEEVVRLAVGWRRLRTGRWLRNLTAPHPEPERPTETVLSTRTGREGVDPFS
jgi:putative MATE family efflux protein